MYDVIGMIKSAADAIAGVAQWALHRSGLKNSPEMAMADKKKKEARENDEINKSTRDGSDDDIRDDISP